MIQYINKDNFLNDIKKEFQNVINTYDFNEFEKQYFDEIEILDTYAEDVANNINEGFNTILAPNYKDTGLYHEKMNLFWYLENTLKYNRNEIEQRIKDIQNNIDNENIQRFKNDLTSFIPAFFGYYDMKYKFADMLSNICDNLDKEEEE